MFIAHSWNPSCYLGSLQSLRNGYHYMLLLLLLFGFFRVRTLVFYIDSFLFIYLLFYLTKQNINKVFATVDLLGNSSEILVVREIIATVAAKILRE